MMNRLNQTRWSRKAAAVAAVLGFVSAGHADNGRIEIAPDMIPYTITNAGSYYLSGDVRMTGENVNGINVMADDVTLDLNGFSLLGNFTTNGGCGVYQSISNLNLVVKNGTVEGWRKPSFQGAGIWAGGTYNRIEHILASHNDFGIYVEDSGMISECAASSNVVVGVIGGNFVNMSECLADKNGTGGFNAGLGCILRECNACDNSGIRGDTVSGGFEISSFALVARCVATRNAYKGICGSHNLLVLSSAADQNFGHGIAITRAASLIANCAAFSNSLDGINIVPEGGSGSPIHGNLVTGCAASRNTDHGIYVRKGSALIVDCTAGRNGDAGIELDCNGCLVRNNHCRANQNGVVLDGSFMHFGGHGNRFEDNTAISNGTGFLIQDATNLIMKNAASGNLTNYVVNAGNNTNNVISDATTKGWTWANFSF